MRGGVDILSEIIYHYGIKGMKWGTFAKRNEEAVESVRKAVKELNKKG